LNDEPISATYVEGDIVGAGWSYRINRVVKGRDHITYSALLTHQSSLPRSEKLYVWLAEFKTLDEARAAARQVLRQWSSLSQPAPGP